MSEYDPGLDAIVRTDRFVDALAGGARMSPVDPLSAMLGNWRDEVRRQPDAHVVTLAQASAALARTQKPLRRNRIGLAIAGAAAAAVLGVGGAVAIGYDSLFGQSTTTRTDAVSLAAQELDQVQQLVDQGKWDEAQQKLITLAPTVQNVGDAQSKQGLVQEYNLLTAKVIQRNPEATPPPPGAPPPPPVSPQSPLSFLPLPVIETSTTSPSSIDPNMMISPSSNSSSSSSSSPPPSSPSSSASSSTASPSPSPSPSPSSSPSSPSPSPSSSPSSPSPKPPVSKESSETPAQPAPPITVTSPAVQAPAPPAVAPAPASPPAAEQSPAAPPEPDNPSASANPKKPKNPRQEEQPGLPIPTPSQAPKGH